MDSKGRELRQRPWLRGFLTWYTEAPGQSCSAKDAEKQERFLPAEGYIQEKLFEVMKEGPICSYKRCGGGYFKRRKPEKRLVCVGRLSEKELPLRFLGGWGRD